MRLFVMLRKCKLRKEKTRDRITYLSTGYPVRTEKYQPRSHIARTQTKWGPCDVTEGLVFFSTDRVTS